MACNICSKDIRIHEGMMTIHATCLTAIRADERAKVEREVVAFLLRRTRVRGLFQSVASILEELQRGEHRPNPGQPKEGGDDGTER